MIDRKTKFKIIRITIFWVFVAYLYIYREKIITDFRRIATKEKWEQEAPTGQLINGKKYGEWRTYFKNGQLARLENYQNDTLHGKQIWYTPEGYYKSRNNYDMGVRVDSSFMYDSKGKLNYAEYRDSTGIHQGSFTVYTNGQITQTGSYKDGKFDGEFKTFFRTGQLKATAHYKLNERIGKWVELSEKGDTITVQWYGKPATE